MIEWQIGKGLYICNSTGLGKEKLTQTNRRVHL